MYRLPVHKNVNFLFQALKQLGWGRFFILKYPVAMKKAKGELLGWQVERIKEEDLFCEKMEVQRGGSYKQTYKAFVV